MRESSCWPSANTAVCVLNSAFVIAFIGVVLGCQGDVTSRPTEQISWKAYTEKSETSHLRSGKCVFVFVYPELSQSSLPALNGLSASKLKRLCQDRTYVAFLLKYDDWNDSRVIHVAQMIGYRKKPFVVFYSPDGNTVALDPSSLSELELKAIGR